MGVLERDAHALATSRHLLGNAAWKTLEWDVRRIAETRRHLAQDEAEALEVARERVAAVDAVGGDVARILQAPRPLLTGEEFMEWIPRGQRNGRTGPELLADATVLTRFANPAHTRRSDEDGRRAAVTAVDRVDALLHLAEKLAARTLTFLHGGADLLGGGLRDAVLPAQLSRARTNGCGPAASPPWRSSVTPRRSVARSKRSPIPRCRAAESSARCTRCPSCVAWSRIGGRSTCESRATRRW